MHPIDPARADVKVGAGGRGKTSTTHTRHVDHAPALLHIFSRLTETPTMDPDATAPSDRPSTS